jgi:membrane-bound serine protease (ClpP class)
MQWSFSPMWDKMEHMKPTTWIVCLAAALALARPAAAQTPTTAPASAQKTAIIQLTGEINDFNRDQFFRRFDQARAAGANIVVVDLDTYGGLVTAGLEISRYLKRQTDIHTIAFVQDKAISAGAMIAMACDEIVMSHSATLGDCAPIVFQFDGSLEDLPPAERAKQESPILADFEESARRNHHDILLADAMVDVKVSVYWVQSPDGERKFVNKDDYSKLIAKGWKDVPNVPVPLNAHDTLLTVDSDHAVMYGLATGFADDAHALASQRDYAIVADIQTTDGDRLVEIIGSWPVRMLLLVIFLSCANFVIHAPGHGVAEVIGLGALLLMLGVPLLTGYAQWWEILTLFVGLGLIAFEILLPGHIFPGITGAVLVVFSLVMTFVPREPTDVPGFLPAMHSTWIAVERGLAVVSGGLIFSAIIWGIMNRFLPKVPYFNRIILSSTSGGGAPPPLPGALWPAVGAVGKAVSELKPGGAAEFYDASTAHGRQTSVVSASGFIPPGSSVVVSQVAGNRVVVRLA